MRRNEARNLIPEDQIDEKAMEERVSKTEADIAKIELGMREFSADLKAANEAIVEVKIAVGAVDGKISALNMKVDARAEAVDARFDALDAKIDAHAQTADARFDAMNVKFDAHAKAVDARLDAMNTKLDAHAKTVEVKFGALDTRVGSLESKVDEMGAKLDESNKSIHSLEGMQKAIVWLLTGGFGSLIALATLAKMFRWI